MMQVSQDEGRPYKGDELPTGWVEVGLRDLVRNPKEAIVDGPFGSNLKASEYVESGVPIIRLQNIDRDRFIFKNIKYVTPEKARELRRHSFESGDLVITKLGDPLGKACLVPESLPKGIIVADVVRARIDENYVRKKYLVHCINSDVVISQLAAKTKGTTRPRVNLGHIRNIQLPLAPYPEQTRIVDELEKQFTRLDAAVASLKRVQANLERYKASVLKAACEGRLVPQDPSDEPAELLLARILAERRHKWKEQEWQKLIERAKKKAAQASRKLAGRPARIKDLEPEEWQDLPEEVYRKYLPKNDKWKQKYKEPERPDTSELPELPAGWVWVSLDQVAEQRLGKMLDKQKNVGELRSYLRNANVRWFSFDLSDLLQMRVKDDELDDVSVQYGDLVVCEGGEPGRCAVWDKPGQTFVIQKALHRVRTAEGVSAWFIALSLAADAQNGRLEPYFTGSTIKHFTGQSLRQYRLPLPPGQEQLRIVDEVERRFTILSTTERDIEASFARCERLRQAVLDSAFSGCLVPQDPDDEPASALLERLGKDGRQRSQKAKKPDESDEAHQPRLL